MGTLITWKGELLRIDPTNPMKIQYAKKDGRTWYTKCNLNAVTGEAYEIFDNGNEILLRCEKGLFASKTGSTSSWSRRS